MELWRPARGGEGDVVGGGDGGAVAGGDGAEALDWSGGRRREMRVLRTGEP